MFLESSLWKVAKKGPKGKFTYNEGNETLISIYRPVLKKIVPDFPGEQMKVILYVEFAY